MLGLIARLVFIMKSAGIVNVRLVHSLSTSSSFPYDTKRTNSLK